MDKFFGKRGSHAKAALSSCLLLCLSLLSGCSAQSPADLSASDRSQTPNTNLLSCGRDLHPVWADQNQLKQDVITLSSEAFEGRKTATQGAQLTRAYLTQRFNDIGLSPMTRLQPSAQEPTAEQRFDVPFQYEKGFSDKQGINLVGVLMATKPTSRWRIVIAHYDHLGKQGSRVFHGADDNASGIAAMLQLASRAKWLGQTNAPEQANSNLMFIASDAEEPGLFGSKALVPLLLQHISPRYIELAINLDMVGHPSRPYAIFLDGTRRFTKIATIMPKLSQNNNLCIRLSHPKPMGRDNKRVDWLRASDHYAFHEANLPWLYFGVPPHPQYHTPDDTSDRIDFDFLAAVSESAFELITINQKYLQ